MAPKGINIFLTYLIVFPATKCKDYNGNVYSIGQTWITKFGQMKCTFSGVIVEKGMYQLLFIIFNEIIINNLDIVLLICFIKILGCMRDGRFIPIDSSLTYDKDGIRWTCRCETIDANRQSLKCTGQYI